MTECKLDLSRLIAPFNCPFNCPRSRLLGLGDTQHGNKGRVASRT